MTDSEPNCLYTDCHVISLGGVCNGIVFTKHYINTPFVQYTAPHYIPSHTKDMYGGVVY